MMTKQSVSAIRSGLPVPGAVYLEITPAVRQALELLADAAILLLDEVDRLSEDIEDDELEVACEDEGGQCDDEGEQDGDANEGWPEWDGKGMHVAHGTAFGEAE
ncbi:hypothetical protein [Telmatospirillum sp.]|uniref:hypothetical protein n=1 Tax=Telmatospirillum sp. TaxID=2079197 RepID=UPI00284EDB73|nr:hypothetical protein [Telmatospirillum sp.]MDR3438730.1 hypothetical protein [Telmatospirillum sp.]